MSKPYELTIIDNYGNSRIPVYQVDIQAFNKTLEAFYGVKSLELKENYQISQQSNFRSKKLKSI